MLHDCGHSNSICSVDRSKQSWSLRTVICGAKTRSADLRKQPAMCLGGEDKEKPPRPDGDVCQFLASAGRGAAVLLPFTAGPMETLVGERELR